MQNVCLCVKIIAMNTVLGILAHVDAGKTTLSEAILYRAGAMRTLGRVDDKNTVMDTHALERERKITIFSSEAAFTVNGADFTLLDTPGHVDFSAETERTLSVLDIAVLVISASDGVQPHTRTLWRLLDHYSVPTVIFVTKTDLARRENDEILSELKGELSPNCIDYFGDSREELALCRDDLLDKYLETGALENGDIAELLASRLAFPVFFGSGLKLTGVDEFLDALTKILPPKIYPNEFGARVYKVSRDGRGERLCHLKITGGTLSVRDAVGDSKVNAIRIYSGAKFDTRERVQAGDICAVTGLSANAGDGLGFERLQSAPSLVPVMSYRVVINDGTDPQAALSKLKLLQEEDPQLKFSWDGFLQQIHVSLMGEVQTEILKSIAYDRLSLDIDIADGEVMYRETVENKVEGVGHFEPLRHYAEVHLIIEPTERGRGIVTQSIAGDDGFSRSWQRLCMGHLAEKEHLGVLTGSPITDVKITLASGRAHQKHTEGGDFRQAVYRAVRQGLMSAKSVLLEPYYAFTLELPPELIGRAINDIRAKSGDFCSPDDAGDMLVLKGTAPVATMLDYAKDVAAYSGGRGRLTLTLCGYDVCHNPDEVISRIGYSPDADTDNTADSVFCAHGAGFNVKWDKVPEYMHLESVLARDVIDPTPKILRRNLNIDEKELEAIMTREFGPISRRQYGIAKVQTTEHSYNEKTARKKRTLIVDGYNVIFAWDDLAELAAHDLESARIKLVDILANYSAFSGLSTVCVFDAYRVSGGEGEKFTKNNVRVVFTKEHETADVYIEKLVADIGKNDSVSVVTSDGLIQLSAIRSGVMRISAREFERDIDDVYRRIAEGIEKINKHPKTTIGDII